jgi:hypothetical protein
VSVWVDEQRKASSRDAALIALAHARDQIGVADDRLSGDRSVTSDSKGDPGSKTGALEAPQSLSVTNPMKPSQRIGREALSMWRLLGLGALVPIGVVILGWHFLYRPVDVAPLSTASVSVDLLAKPAAPSPASPRSGSARGHSSRFGTKVRPQSVSGYDGAPSR